MKLVTQRCSHCTTCKASPAHALYQCEAIISPLSPVVTMEGIRQIQESLAQETLTQETLNPHITRTRIEEEMKRVNELQALEGLLPRELLPHQRRMLEQAWNTNRGQRLSERNPQEQRVPHPQDMDHAPSFISPRLTKTIQTACKQDERMDFAWTQITGRVQSGLDDYIVQGVFDTLIQLFKIWDDDKAQRDERNLNNIRSLGEAAREALDAFESAKDRESVLYMVDTMEELDAALYDLTQKDT